ncbi:MAG: YajQ family cyclic di-GMP-binding protein [Bdellovibrionales bacterium CG10_big_fil_rev_8_21_14_0_10_45_34]|nr:MAG: YajQ family cyclic di-GMP-binding protein [Bdellovibrionales bacterium CG10_big_fil_rev_8_21_14_0_10_45_34]
MPSFDIVSEIDLQEADNAVQQARKEIGGRYDFRGSKSEIHWDKKIITILADDDYKLGAMKDILQSKFHKRGIDIRVLKFSEPEPASGMMKRQKVDLIIGIESETAKKITKSIRDSKLKVQSQIMDDKVRVTSKSIDELQTCIQFVKDQDFTVALQYTNMRS